ncbi:hypothetical protein HELRODRAFT_182038 [Helobdella robusta]|uniref:Sugar phosphate transporter domain-containing protein n=1 Tax=Helobdella robusta TaxID=6412 RepID=T1FHM7_HELRO|nr:hypothetical protein HELRODRAFT_182038 [Helobdella robusta]ESN91861.1 hypothetical protein HELRODRAFT_182038 [Helobdella robusta]
MTEKASITKIAVVVLSYWVISISMVFANKYLVGNINDNNISLFVSWVQCIITFLIGLVISAGGSLFCKTSSIRFDVVSRISWTESNMWPVFKMAGFFVGMLAFNNLCSETCWGLFLSAVARSMTIIFVVIFSLIILKRHISYTIIFCCLMVAIGFILGIDQEGLGRGVSAYGVFFGVTSSIFIALTGFLISWISAVQINVTSPVSHHISANCKAILQTIIAVSVYSESKSWLWWLSVCLVVTGACLYAVQRYREEEEEKRKQQLLPLHVDVSNDQIKIGNINIFNYLYYIQAYAA